MYFCNFLDNQFSQQFVRKLGSNFKMIDLKVCLLWFLALIICWTLQTCGIGRNVLGNQKCYQIECFEAMKQTHTCTRKSDWFSCSSSGNCFPRHTLGAKLQSALRKAVDLDYMIMNYLSCNLHSQFCQKLQNWTKSDKQMTFICWRENMGSIWNELIIIWLLWLLLTCISIYMAPFSLIFLPWHTCTLYSNSSK